MGKSVRKYRKSRDYDRVPPVTEKASPYDVHDGKGPQHGIIVHSDLLSSPREFVPLDQLPPGHASPVRIVLTMMTCSVGVTAVALPHALLQGGFVMGIFMFLFVTLVTHISRTRLVELGVDQGIYSLQGLAKLAFGPAGAFTVAATQLGTSLGLMVFYLIAAFRDGPILLGHWLKMDFDADGRPVILPGTKKSALRALIADKYWFAEALMLVVIIPYCLYVNSYQRMRVTPVIVCVALVAASYSVVVKARADHEANADKSSQGYDRDYLDVPSTICQAFAVITMSLVSQHHSFHAFYAMGDRSTATFKRLSAIATLGSIAIGLAFAIGGYVSFLGSTKSDVLLNYDFSNNRLLLPFWSLVPVAAIGCFSFEMIISRHTAQLLCRRSKEPTSEKHDVLFTSQQPSKTSPGHHLYYEDHETSWTSYASSFVVLVLVAQVAIFSTADAGVVLSLTGGLAGIILCFIVPAACQLKLADTYESWCSDRVLPILSIVIGVVGATASVVATAVQVQTESTSQDVAN